MRMRLDIEAGRIRLHVYVRNTIRKDLPFESVEKLRGSENNQLSLGTSGTARQF